MRGDRVVNSQVVQSELPRHRPELMDIGRYSPIHAMPFRSPSSS
jgi:hypothetical protein